MRGRQSVLALLLFFILYPQLGHAQGVRFQPQGATAAGQGNAFSAQADDPSAIHYNPAGLSQVNGIQVLSGTTLVGGSVKYTSPTGVDSRGDFGGTIANPPPSYSYVSANLGSLGWNSLSNVTVGLGVNSPFGLNIRYPVDGPFNTVVTAAALPLIAIKPTLAYKLNDQLAFGASADRRTPANPRAREMSSSASASCGTAFGDTKLVASRLLNPAANSRLKSSSFCSVGIRVAWPWSPSRSATSVIRI